MSLQSHAGRQVGWVGWDEKGANWWPKVIPPILITMHVLVVIYISIRPIPVILTITALQAFQLIFSGFLEIFKKLSLTSQLVA